MYLFTVFFFECYCALQESCVIGGSASHSKSALVPTNRESFTVIYFSSQVRPTFHLAHLTLSDQSTSWCAFWVSTHIKGGCQPNFLAFDCAPRRAVLRRVDLRHWFRPEGPDLRCVRISKVFVKRFGCNRKKTVKTWKDARNSKHHQRSSA